ncbi:MAG: winged helix-turn-helix transcriptional regulator [Acidimicrobiales bacterium]|nr:winged helix-turn-helix transcriptional regulator [Acidimicrobiales bacterium]
MANSRKAETVGNIQRLVIDLCLGAWAELGVSSWARTHQNWAVDPEPLVIFTAGFAKSDPRLRDEAIDWCIRNWRHLSQVRLRNILKCQSNELLSEWGPFAATVNVHAGIRWPLATTELPYKKTGRTNLRPLTEPSLVLLRMREMFGLGARSEILRYFLFHPSDRVTAAMLSEVTSYAKRNVAEACDALVQAGLLSARLIGNRYYYSIARAERLADFVGAIPLIVPNGNALLRVASAIFRVASLANEVSDDVLVVEVRNVVAEIENDLDTLDIGGLKPLHGAAILGEWSVWSSEVARCLASGIWPTTPSG